MENLNKENFFDKAFEKYPEAAKMFHAWIDDYKKQIGWDDLFGNTVRTNIKDSIAGGRVPKFHEIPYDMQKGILLRFLCECYPNSTQQYVDVNKFKTVLDRSLRVIEIMAGNYDLLNDKNY